MTGVYPDVPTRRIPYDRDGSAGFYAQNSSTAVALSAGQMQNLNVEAGVSALLTSSFSSGANTGFVGFIFPQNMDIVAYYIQYLDMVVYDYQTSTNTTNGTDGTWTSIGPFVAGPNNVDDYRDSIQVLGSPLTNIKAIRFRTGGSLSSASRFYTVHLYGTPTVTSTFGLSIWHPTLNQEVTGAYFDWGDVAQSSTGTRQFRVKNQHPSLTAQGISVSMEALTPGSPSIVAAHTFSTDNVTYTSSIAPADLAAGAISPILYIKRTLPSNAPLSVWAGRIVAAASAFV